MIKKCYKKYFLTKITPLPTPTPFELAAIRLASIDYIIRLSNIKNMIILVNLVILDNLITLSNALIGYF